MEKVGETSNGSYEYNSPPAYDGSAMGYPLEHDAADTAPVAPAYCVPVQQASAQHGVQMIVTDGQQTYSVPLVQSFMSHIFLACFTFCCCGCGCICGFVALILAGHDTVLQWMLAYTTTRWRIPKHALL